MNAGVRESAARRLDRLERLTAALDEAAQDLADADATFADALARGDAARDHESVFATLEDAEIAASKVVTIERRLDRLARLVLRDTAAISRLIAAATPVAGRLS